MEHVKCRFYVKEPEHGSRFVTVEPAEHGHRLPIALCFRLREDADYDTAQAMVSLMNVSILDIGFG